jgi:hypothetical protein
LSLTLRVRMLPGGVAPAFRRVNRSVARWFRRGSGLILRGQRRQQGADSRVNPSTSTVTGLVIAALFLVPALGRAQERPFIDEPEHFTSNRVQEGEPWKEGSAGLPPWPADSDLVEFHVDGEPSPFRYFIDGKHLSVGSDGVVRYTLVVESSTGVRNVSFEGLRCTLRGVYKVYAYGSGGSFKRVEEDWQPIQERGNDPYHRDLYQALLCVPLKMEPRPKKDMIRALEGHVHRRDNAGFLPD